MTVISIELNELNFEFVRRYVESGGFLDLLGCLMNWS